MNGSAETITTNQWTLRVRKPAGKGPFQVIALIHGWTGDENSMWVFASRLPANVLLIAPRGIYRAQGGGFGWCPVSDKPWPDLDDFMPSVEALQGLFSSDIFPDADFTDLSMVGFSQGAALMFAYSLQMPDNLIGLAGLSGFLPEKLKPLIDKKPLSGKQVFVAHGIRDDLIPVEKARLAVSTLEEAGADVSYCEADVGHKLGAACFRSLGEFFRGIIKK